MVFGVSVSFFLSAAQSQQAVRPPPLPPAARHRATPAIHGSNNSPDCAPLDRVVRVGRRVEQLGVLEHLAHLLEHRDGLHLRVHSQAA